MPRPKLPLLLLAASLSLGVAAPSADASTRYVRTGGVDAGNDCTVLATPCATPERAFTLSEVAMDADTVDIGPGTFSGSSSYSAAGPVTVFGAGRGKTVLTYSNPQPPTYGRVLSIHGGAGNSVRDLSIALSGGSARGLELKNGAQAQRVDVAGDATATDAQAVIIDSGGSFTDGSASLVGAGGDAVNVTGGPTGTATIARADLTAEYGVYQQSYDTVVAQVSRTRIVARQGVLLSGGQMNIANSVIEPVGTNAVALSAFASNGSTDSRTLTANHVTVAGSGASGQTGAYALSTDASQTAAVAVKNSILTGVAAAFRRRSNTTGVANVTGSYDASTAPNLEEGGPGAISESHHVAAAPGFVDAAAGDFRLRFDPALVDAGDPAAGGPTVDFGGDPRVVDGNGDGTAVRDIGAFEYQHRAPVVAASAGNGGAFSATASDPDAGDAVTVHWTFDDGGSADGFDVTHTFASAGSHTATATATDSSGLTAQATVTVEVPATGGSDQPPPAGPGPGPGPTEEPPPTPPVAVAHVNIGRVARVSGRRVVVRLSCTVAAPCRGRLALRLRGRGARSLGSVRFSLGAGKSARVRVKLSRKGAALVAARHGRGSARAVARSGGVRIGRRTVALRVRRAR